MNCAPCPAMMKQKHNEFKNIHTDFENTIQLWIILILRIFKEKISKMEIGAMVA